MNEVKEMTNPEWIKLFNTFSGRGYNSIITYDELNETIVRGDVRKEKRHVFEKFKKELMRQKNKVLENIPKMGYRIVNPNEHVRLTNREIKRAERRARVAVDIILHTDMDQLTEKERAVASLAAARVQPILATLIGEQRALKQERKFSLPEYPRG